MLSIRRPSERGHSALAGPLDQNWMSAVDLHEDGGAVLESGGDHFMPGVGRILDPRP